MPMWSPELRIDRCVCQRVLFERLLPVARTQAWTLEQLMDETGCGDQCGMCRPYLRRMLADGTTVFRELLEEQPDATCDAEEAA
jgi:bacterioferritin-associated ferredoxin